MIDALFNQRTNTKHLRTQKGQPYCGARIDTRTIPIEVRTPAEINCDRCRGSRSMQLYATFTEEGATSDAEYVAKKWTPPRSRGR